MKAEMEMTRDTTASEEKCSGSYWGFVLWPVAVIVLYVLSAGPISLGVYKGTVNATVLGVYTPLETVVGATPLKQPFGKYIFWWSPGAFDRYWRSGLVDVNL